MTLVVFDVVEGAQRGVRTGESIAIVAVYMLFSVRTAKVKAEDVRLMARIER